MNLPAKFLELWGTTCKVSKV